MKRLSAVFLISAFLFPSLTFADSKSDLIAALMAQIAALNQQIAIMKNVAPSATPTQSTTPTQATTPNNCVFSRTLKVGSSGDDVTCMQNYLIKAGYLVTGSGATGYFGALTKSAVIAWQSAKGVSPASGIFGPLSQAKFNSGALSSGGGSNVTNTVSNGSTQTLGTLSVTSIFPNQFLSNTVSSFTIKGTGFQSGAKVYLGTGQELPVTVVVDSNTINSRTLGDLPPANYNLIVTNPDGKSVTLPSALSFINAPQNVSAAVLSSQEIFNKVAPATVLILAFGDSQSCTGALISSDGNILTNAHCVRNLAGSYTQTVDVYLNDGGYLRSPYKFFSGSVIGVDAINDLAIVKITGTNLPTIPLGNSDDSSLPFTSPVYALGFPLIFQVSNYTDSLTILPGTVTGRGSTIIQISANIQHGNSGGPLVNKNAELVGINQICTVQTDINTYCPQGFGGAIPINNIKPLIPQLESGYTNYGSTQTPSYTTPNSPTTPTPTTPTTPTVTNPPSLTISASANFPSQNVVSGSSIISGGFQLDASQSGEDIRMSSLKINEQDVSGSPSVNLSTCQLWNGSTALNTGSNVLNVITANADNAVSFDNALTVSKGSVMSIAIRCNLATSATGSYKFGITSAPEATGIRSGNSFNPTISSGYSGIMTAVNPSVTISVDPSSPSYALAAGGVTGFTAGVIRLHPTGEAFYANKIGLTLTSGSPSDITQVSLYNGATAIGTATFGGATAVSTLTSSLLAQRDSDTTITIKVDLGGVGASSAGHDGDFIKIDPLNVQGTGLNSGMTISANATPGVYGLRLFKSLPTIALDPLGSSGIADGRLMHFKITANAAGPVGIGKIHFNVLPTVLSVANIQLYGFTDSSYSQPIAGQSQGGKVGDTANGSDFTITAASPIQVPAGSTYYFEIRGDVSGVTTGSSAVTKLLGDSSYDGMNTQSGVSGNFIWSPNANGTSAGTDSDWTNGFSVQGLPSSGLTQVRAN